MSMTHSFSLRRFSFPPLLALLALSLSALPAGAETVFGPPADLNTDSNPRSVATADFNGDGHADLAVGSSPSKRSEIRYGAGNGAFGPGTEVPLDLEPSTLVVGDFNGDRRPDLAASGGASGAAVVLNTPDDGFQRSANFNIDVIGRGLAAGDFNGDGDGDLVLLTTCADCYNGGPDFAALLYRSRGDGTFHDPVTYPVAVPWAFPLAPGTELSGSFAATDLNGDGRTDLIATVGFSRIEEGAPPVWGGAVKLFQNAGDGSFQFPRPIATTGKTLSTTVGDFNGDGLQDAAFSTVYSTRESPRHFRYGVHVYQGISQGGLSYLNSQEVPYAGDLSAGDFNGDGREDLATVPDPGPAFNSGLLVLRGLGDGSFDFPLQYGDPRFAFGLAKADFNEDGQPDLAALNGDAPLVSVFLSREGRHTLFSLALGSPTPRTHVVIDMAAGDLNEDGTPDQALLLTQREGAAAPYNRVRVLLRERDGSATPVEIGAEGIGPVNTLRLIRIGEFNGDGNLDLVLLHGEDSAGTPQGYLIPGSGTGGFGAAPIRFSQGPGFSDVEVGDFNGDGSDDLLLAGNGRVALLPGNGNGTFSAEQSYSNPCLTDPRSALGDFNKDGRGDLAVTGPACPEAYVFFGSPEGTLPDPLKLGLDAQPGEIGVAELNRDSQPDLAILAARNGQSVALAFLGNGDGTFREKMETPYEGETRLMAAVDSDGDGAGDLAVTDRYPDSVALLLGNGDGTFRPDPGRHFVGVDPVAISAGDFTGDGQPDLLTANALGPDVTLLANRFSAVTLGDVNADGRVDILDALLALRIAVGMHSPSPAEQAAADVVTDGEVTVEDVIRILQVVVGLRSTPVSNPPRSDAFQSALAPFWTAKQTLGPQSSLPAPSLSVQNGRLSLTSANNDVWLGTWEPYFVYQEGIVGDFTMQVKVESVPACSPYSGVGLMVAQNVPDRYAQVGEIPTWAMIHAANQLGTEAKWGGRGNSRTSYGTVTAPALKLPYWLRLDRRGDEVTFYTSKDGRTWSVYGSPVNLAAVPGVYSLQEPVSAGIVMQTHCVATPGTAVVSDFRAGDISLAGRLP